MKTLHLGDCLDVMKEMEDKSVDLIVTDPPYKVITGGMTSGFSHGTGNIFQESGTGLLFKHNDIDIKQWASTLFSKLKDGCHAYVFVNSLNLCDFLVELKRVGFIHQNVLVWYKNNKNASRTYMKDCEYVLFLRKGKHKTINNASSPTVLQFKNPKPKSHPTEKPVDLLSLFVSNSSSENDVVFDPFMGTGSTGVASLKLKRKFIGIEKDESYYQIACERINGSREGTTTE